MANQRLIGAGLALVLAGLAGSLEAAEKVEAKGEKVEYQPYTSYFESNKSGLKGDESFLAFTDQKAFDQVLRPVPPLMGQKPVLLPRDVFEARLVLAVIKRGNQPYQYKVNKVTADGSTLYVQYDATAGKATTATFASPLLVAVDKGKYTSVVFIENGKKAGTATVGK